MAKFRINIFYVISSICCLFLIAYIWTVFLPIFQGAQEYPSVQNLAIWLTILLIVVIAIQLYLSLMKVGSKEEVEEIEIEKGLTLT